MIYIMHDYAVHMQIRNNPPKHKLVAPFCRAEANHVPTAMPVRGLNLAMALAVPVVVRMLQSPTA